MSLMSYLDIDFHLHNNLRCHCPFSFFEDISHTFTSATCSELRNYGKKEKHAVFEPFVGRKIVSVVSNSLRLAILTLFAVQAQNYFESKTRTVLYGRGEQRQSWAKSRKTNIALSFDTGYHVCRSIPSFPYVQYLPW